ncbi:MAG: hypothetical protein HY814_09825 [Candidatus Riflebacteria bacterium]|nr:hypothetical protein [Candidatus Riflebacteria bacterium]
MSDSIGQGKLFPEVAALPGTVAVNSRVSVRTAQGHRVVTAAAVILHSYSVEDRVAEGYAMVLLVDTGLANQKEVARAFSHSVRTVRRDQARFALEGLNGLGRPRGRQSGIPRVARAGVSRDQTILRLKLAPASNRTIAGLLGIDEKTVRKALRRMGWNPPDHQGRLFNEPQGHSSARVGPCPTLGSEMAVSGEATKSDAGERELSSSEEAIVDTQDPLDRSLARLLAALGLVEDALPLFAEAAAVPGAGVLLAIPALVDSKLLSTAERI